ncbi:uncharacterized protein Z519_10126 [Cladophialophora bantiana CBS 173.52]|uniref:DUF3431 domain-containing protein n=1 Tax=Cladophialophora bantiana (strain ATCC 10958 / CBS 173.52 / CDC B-1940 / NIH 8579) TaxID=1442370 RepID=A0A0D2H7I8_CLAB1|nr:uncharacterized protein Z519_10126 [Cladophialophora bantiana CBS 173.52]KIW89273.1 hypothetical protein Z519_10126 [Cladophialophora bantiana CBS 173.52]
MPFFRRPSILSLVLAAFILTLLLNGFGNFSPEQSYQDGPSYNPSLFSPGTAKPAGENYSRVLVMARLSTEDASWLDKDLPELPRKIYTVDSPHYSGLPANKGNEAMAYLTYIIDHYDSLPDIVLFFHPPKKSWHNNIVLDTDTAITIKLLSDAHVMRQGYFNTRCHLDPGCPDWLHVDRPKWRYDLQRKPEEPALSSSLFDDLFGSDVAIPRAISQPCCAQFAVSGERIRQRPLRDYVHYRDWLLRTALDDKISGRILEYSWHYIFTGVFEWCPSPHRCYCDGYGICFEGGEQGLRKWLDSFRAKEVLDRKLQGLWRGGDEGGSKKFKKIKDQSGRLGRELDEAREQALKRGFDPQIRAKEYAREWHEGDGF